MTLVAIALYVPLARITGRSLAVATTIALGILVVMNWTMFDNKILAVVLLAAFGLLAARLKEQLMRGLTYVLIAVFGVAPLVQLVTSHIRDTQPYPIVELAERRDATATGVVEDLLFVVVDGYPSLGIARDWFGHDSGEMVSHLEALEFQVFETAWTQHTFTGLAVPSMLELQPIAEPGPTSYGNRTSTFNIMRGDSLVADALRSADFTYTHVEGGWDGDVCGDVDRCLGGPLFDEKMILLLGSSLFGSWLEESGRSYIVDGTFNSVDSLKSIREVFGDGNRDYVFSHLMLPHDPYVVDSDCQVLSQSNETHRIDEQFTCVDRLISEISEFADDSTAVVIAADHGSHTLEQRFLPAHEWTDAQIAERFAVFLAYRFPEGCTEPGQPTNIEVMSAAVSCAIDIEVPDNHGRFLIGADNPDWVDEERMERIQTEVEAGLIERPDG